MSVYIKGMEMPTSCAECVFKSVTGVDRWKCRVLNAEFMSWYVGWGGEETRRIDCPLVPVPPHGRLIDADAIRYFKDDSNLLDFDYAYRSQINSMPTIIPADPADKEGEG